MVETATPYKATFGWLGGFFILNVGIQQFIMREAK